jgi:serine/threonine-protein kinase RsbW
MAGEAARITVRCDEFAPVAVRRHLAQLTEVGWVLGDAMLVATELVTNAVRHSLCREDDVLVILVEQTPPTMRLSVLDPGTSGGTARLADEAEPFGRLGLKIVEQLTTRWGSNRSADGHEVWAELPLADAQPSVVGCGP